MERCRERINPHDDPKLSIHELPPLEAVLQEAEPQAYLRMTSLSNDAYLMWAGDQTSLQYCLERINRKTRVRLIEQSISYGRRLSCRCCF